MTIVNFLLINNHHNKERREMVYGGKVVVRGGIKREKGEAERWKDREKMKEKRLRDNH